MLNEVASRVFGRELIKKFYIPAAALFCIFSRELLSLWQEMNENENKGTLLCCFKGFLFARLLQFLSLFYCVFLENKKRDTIRIKFLLGFHNHNYTH